MGNRMERMDFGGSFAFLHFCVHESGLGIPVERQFGGRQEAKERVQLARKPRRDLLIRMYSEESGMNGKKNIRCA